MKFNFDLLTNDKNNNIKLYVKYTIISCKDNKILSFFTEIVLVYPLFYLYVIESIL